MLRSEDQEFLNRKNWRWECRQDPTGYLHVIVHDYALPEKYSPSMVAMLVRIPPGYPESGLDMFWTSPDVRFAATGAYPPATEVHENYMGVAWQRWSRHMNGWRPGTDNLETFFGAIHKELNR